MTLGKEDEEEKGERDWRREREGGGKEEVKIREVKRRKARERRVYALSQPSPWVANPQGMSL